MALLFVTTRIKQREAILKLYNREQAEDESITRYYYELMNLASEAFPGTDKGVLDAYVHEQFLHGIRNPIVQKRLIHDYGKASELEDVVRVAKIYEEEEESENKFENKLKDHKIRKIYYSSNDSTDSNSEEEQRIRRIDRRSYKRYDSRYSRGNDSKNYSDERRERQQDTRIEENNKIPMKHTIEESDKKKTVTVNEAANITHNTIPNRNENKDNNFEHQNHCYHCDGRYHNYYNCPFRRKSRFNN